MNFLLIANRYVHLAHEKRFDIYVDRSSLITDWRDPLSF